MGWENVDEGRAREGGSRCRAQGCRETICDIPRRARIIEFHLG